MADRVRTIPIWLSLLLILLCLGGGGAFMWWYFNGDGLAGRTVIIPKDVIDQQRAARVTDTPTRRPPGPRTFQLSRNDPDGVTPDPANTPGPNGVSRWTVKAGDASLQIRKVGDRPPVFRYTYLRTDLLTPDQFQVMVATWRLTSDAAMAKAIGLNDDQLNKLRPEAAPLGIVMSDDDRKKIETAFGQTLAAPTDAAAKTTLVAALDEVGKRQLEPTRQKMVERVERIRTLITPQQWETWKKVGG